MPPSAAQLQFGCRDLNVAARSSAEVLLFWSGVRVTHAISVSQRSILMEVPYLHGPLKLLQPLSPVTCGRSAVGVTCDHRLHGGSRVVVDRVPPR
jgi:hypothetical protein